MTPSPCARCHNARALILRPKNQQKLCRECFLHSFETEIHHTITTHSLFRRGERIAIGASGGKDSTVLASVLRTLNERYNYGLEFLLLSIDEGIKGYRDDSLETVKRNSEQYGMELCIVGYGELYGWTMDEVVEQVGKKGNCTYCGVFRRQALDRGAAKMGITHVVTGHNADDVAETVMMNLLRGDLPRLARTTSIITESKGSPIKRSKPLKYAYEKEIVLYAHHKKLDYFSTECIYSPEAFRGSARALIKNLERIRPSAILDIVRSGEDMAKLVPEEVTNPSCLVRSAALTVDEEQESSGGCGNPDVKTSGGEMEEMERRLVENELAQELEQEVTLDIRPERPTSEQDTVERRPQQIATVPLQPQTKIEAREQRRREAAVRHAPKHAVGQNPRKMKAQQLGHCARCGYLSSQQICKACTLLEGLNKSRPRTEIEIGFDEENASSSLANRMKGVALVGN